LPWHTTGDAADGTTLADSSQLTRGSVVFKLSDEQSHQEVKKREGEREKDTKTKG